MKLIVGLGNPDDKYKNTFHNLGFMSVDKVADKLGFSFTKTKCRALIAEGNVNGEKIILAKPLTYMNLSGESVRELVSFYKISTADTVVIYDDYDLLKGVIRIRENGSAGTHNGMRNIIQELGRCDLSITFCRVFPPKKKNFLKKQPKLPRLPRATLRWVKIFNTLCKSITERLKN